MDYIMNYEIFKEVVKEKFLDHMRMTLQTIPLWYIQ